MSCTSCFIKSSPTSCVTNYWSGPPIESSETRPWYNGQSSSEEKIPCDDTIPPCAQCSQRNEDELLTLFPPEGLPDCNEATCDNITIGGDPCFSLGGCEWYCSTLKRLKQICPHISPGQKSPSSWSPPSSASSYILFPYTAQNLRLFTLATAGSFWLLLL